MYLGFSMIKKLILLFLVSLNSYSQVGEYISQFSGDAEHSTKSKGYYFNYFTYLNIKPDKSFKIIITNYSSKENHESCCWKTKGTWKVNKDELILKDKENNQTYRFLIRKNNLIDISYRKYNHLTDSELMFELTSIEELSKEKNEFLNNLGFVLLFEKIKDKSELNNFLMYKESLCK